jgi:hypothetical protein
MATQWPAFRVTGSTDWFVVWEGPLETHCERYILRLQLLRPKFLESAFIWPGASSDNPCVRVVSPELGFYDGERRLPHTYYRNNRPASQADLCLFFGDEWSLDDMVADTIVPWAAEWLQFYEGWRATGTWFGPGLHPGDEEVNEWRRDRTDQPILPDDPPAPYRRCVDSYLGRKIGTFASFPLMEVASRGFSLPRCWPDWKRPRWGARPSVDIST